MSFCVNCVHYIPPCQAHPECNPEPAMCAYPNVDLVSGKQINRTCKEQRSGFGTKDCKSFGYNFRARNTQPKQGESNE